MPIKRLIILLSVIALVAGCGASKNYVDEQIRNSEARTSAQLGDVEGKASATSLDLQKLQALQNDLEAKPIWPLISPRVLKITRLSGKVK